MNDISIYILYDSIHLDYPLINKHKLTSLLIAMENGPFIVDLNIRMVIFHSYITRGSKKTCYAYPPAIEHSNSTCPTNGGLSLFFDGASIAMFDDRVLYPFFDSEIH